MKVSFGGNYLIQFNDQSNRRKLQAYLSRTPASSSYRDINYPVCERIGDKDLLLITGKEAADFRHLKDILYRGCSLTKNEIHNGLCKNFAETAQRVIL